MFKLSQRGGYPKFEHVYLYLLFSAINEDEPNARAAEFVSLLPMMVLWWFCLENNKQPTEEESLS